MSKVCLLVLVEFRSSRPIRTIAGPGGVIGPLPRPNEGGRTTGNKVAKKAEYTRSKVDLRSKYFCNRFRSVIVARFSRFHSHKSFVFFREALAQLGAEQVGVRLPPPPPPRPLAISPVCLTAPPSLKLGSGEPWL